MSTVGGASPAGGPGTHLLFRRHSRLFAVPVVDVAEMIEIPSSTRVPATPAVVTGVINHHGDILPVVDPDVLLDISSDERRHHSGDTIGFIVGEQDARLVIPIDATLGLFQLPREGNAGDGLIRKTVVVEDRAIAVLDVGLVIDRVETLVTGAWKDNAAFGN